MGYLGCTWENPDSDKLGNKRIVLPLESKASFNNPAAGRQGGGVRNNWKQGHPPPWSFTPSFSSPLSDLLFSLSLETGFLRTCIFSHTAPNRFIFFHVLPSARGHADSLTVLLKRKKTRKGFIGPAQSGALPWANQWPVGVSMEGHGSPEGAGFPKPVLGMALLREVGVSVGIGYIWANWNQCSGSSLMDLHSR